ncbi:hypothetical protein [Xenorhabdus bovienii]|uniref:hypothetical protein n=1 Tax=Xenorhabdus bovienii TaxID=40576 RepID=UPI000170A8CB|nr:hypothetical protein [Xenorhabdus bovienii]CDG89999.1 conserved hypothetical protein [Xenorhabdus bovienii str. feltiae France]CDG91486.1 conserved hypothetical protein [Xenorhabdus bovienii str. feltiae Florida]
MAWEVDDSRATWKQIPPAAERKYEEWVRTITASNRHPRDAAEDVGGCNFKMLGGTSSGIEQYTIRLSKDHRVLFTIEGEIVNVRQVGGHT